MGFDHNVCETGLKLGLGFSPAVEIIPAKAGNHNHPSRPKAVALSFEPSLTLGLVSGDKVNDSFINKPTSGEILYRQDSTGASSFSNASVKREREQLGSEETETTARVSSRLISDEDDDGSNGRKKLRLTKAQSALLEESFKQHSTLNPQKQKQELARELNLRPRQVEVWFQNRRARTKLKQTEVDCEYLKKCCETLTEENRRLQKEVQELKALKVAQPLYMQLPAATLTMCPSCERVSGTGPAAPTTDSPSKEPFSSITTPKPHFYNSFPNPSAAC